MLPFDDVMAGTAADRFAVDVQAGDVAAAAQLLGRPGSDHRNLLRNGDSPPPPTGTGEAGCPH